MQRLIVLIILFYQSYSHENKGFQIMKENFDFNFKIENISKLRSFVNESNDPLFRAKCNLSMILKLNSDYEFSNLLNSSVYQGFGQVKDYISIGFVESKIILDVARKEGHILISYGKGYIPPSNNLYSKPIKDYVIAVLFEDTNEIYLHKYIE